MVKEKKTKGVGGTRGKKKTGEGFKKRFQIGFKKRFQKGKGSFF